jgi:hypothetical protein
MPSNLRLKALVVAMSLAVSTVAFAATPAAVLANTSVVTRATQLRAGVVWWLARWRWPNRCA